MRQPFVIVTRRLATRALKKRPVTIRSASVKAFPIVFDTIVNTHDIRTSVTGFAELEVALLSYEVALILASLSAKNLSKNDSKSGSP
jgi:hypothetical protein